MPTPAAPPRFSEQGRSSTRMLVAMPVVISGKAALGQTFEEKTRTVVVNGTGCKLVTEQQLIVGSQLNVAIANGKRTAFATVAWLGERKGKLLEVGVDFNAPDPTFWGVMFPDEPTASGAATPGNDAKPALEIPKPEPKPEPKPGLALPSSSASIPPRPAPSASTLAPLAHAVKSASLASQTNNASTTATAALYKAKVSQVRPPTPPAVTALTPAMNPPPDPSVQSGAAPAKLGPLPVAQRDLASLEPSRRSSPPDSLSPSSPKEPEVEPKVISIRRPQISISDDGLKSLGGDFLLGIVQHLVREAFQEVLTQVVEDFDCYCTTTIERAKNAALAEMQDRIRSAVTEALTPALEAGVQGARTHLDAAAKQISIHHAKSLEATMQQALENTEKALEARVTDYDERLTSTSQQFCKELAQRLQQSSAA